MLDSDSWCFVSCILGMKVPFDFGGYLHCVQKSVRLEVEKKMLLWLSNSVAVGFPYLFSPFFFLALKHHRNITELTLILLFLFFSPALDWSMGLLRRVQPDQHRGVVCGGSADPVHSQRPGSKLGTLCV